MLLVMTYNLGIFLLIVLSTAAANHYYHPAPALPLPTPLPADSFRGRGVKGQAGLSRRVSGEGGGRASGSAPSRHLPDDELDEDELLAKDCCEK